MMCIAYATIDNSSSVYTWFADWNGTASCHYIIGSQLCDDNYRFYGKTEWFNICENVYKRDLPMPLVVMRALFIIQKRQ